MAGEPWWSEAARLFRSVACSPRAPLLHTRAQSTRQQPLPPATLTTCPARVCAVPAKHAALAPLAAGAAAAAAPRPSTRTSRPPTQRSCPTTTANVTRSPYTRCRNNGRRCQQQPRVLSRRPQHHAVACHIARRNPRLRADAAPRPPGPRRFSAHTHLPSPHVQTSPLRCQRGVRAHSATAPLHAWQRPAALPHFTAAP
jgi:hypothetical protein